MSPIHFADISRVIQPSHASCVCFFDAAIVRWHFHSHRHPTNRQLPHPHSSPFISFSRVGNFDAQRHSRDAALGASQYARGLHGSASTGQTRVKLQICLKFRDYLGGLVIAISIRCWAAR
ncbi:hypothetical protein GQ607_011064 [Colletotrichum asianum]|uniref:Uncharacterized protein n=1 Tax=Colletotrichum asianum TaxID=702518 RepID=A0A8H3W5P4_9PEZI|nr:hypothetical protein GQ607_011064 [Colletotrichum asianum]